MDKAVASALSRLARLSEWIYERHADRCQVCCVLGGEFCRAGHHLQQLAEALDR
jgi:hypothetical protein